MVYVVNRFNRHTHSTLVRAMHAERKRVFVDMLHWDLSHEDNLEYDEFDTDDAQYLILQDQESGDHLASLRLLRTDRPHLLGEVFPSLCEEGVPSGFDIREITRFCLSSRLNAQDRVQARNILVRGMIEYGLMAGFSAYTAVCEMSFLSQVLAVGWDIDPLGMPQVIEGRMVGAFRIELAADTLHKMVAAWRCHHPALKLAEFDRPLAA